MFLVLDADLVNALIGAGWKWATAQSAEGDHRGVRRRIPRDVWPQRRAMMFAALTHNGKRVLRAQR